MENVVAFNNELSGLYDTKPPISKAKMAAITKSAMRAIKFYKHVVQSVEKFILKCKPEYKVPGLYVIDSIVRQSRHQYGPEKDVFAPRFARNIKDTFANLFRCAPEDKSRIIRVLNLWQKNNVFAPEVIQPIFDLADPNHPIYQQPPVGGTGGPSGSGSLGDISTNTANGLNVTGGSIDISMGNISGVGLGSGADDKHGGLPDLSNNNLQQLLNDPNVLRQLQTLQNFQKIKQEEQYKMNEMRLQEEAFEKQIQNMLKTTAGPSGTGAEVAEVEFVSEEQKIEVINLDGNDSRSPTPDRDRYKRRRSRSRSRSRDRGRRRRSRSRSRSRSPRSYRRRSSRDRDRNDRNIRDKERDREHERERRKKGLPDIKKEHLSVCSTTLWVGHLSKLVSQEELSDTFGEYGDIVSIDQIVPRGCAFIVMNRRQDAHKAMQGLKNHKLQGRAITISWAAGKGVKSKEWKDFWDLELGVTYIPWSKLNESTDFDSLEEGGMFDEDSMPDWMKDKINQMKRGKEKSNENAMHVGSNMLFGIDTTQPPPGPPPTGGPPPMMPMVPGQFSMAPPMGAPPRMLTPMSMSISGIPIPPNLVSSMPPPHTMMMPTGIMPPAFPPMQGQVGAGGAPPQLGPHIGLPPGANQYPPQPGTVPPPVVGGVGNMPSSDDQMDIEMDEDDGPSGMNAPPVTPSTAAQQLNFSQPPPMFGSSGIHSSTGGGGNEGDMYSRDRNRGGLNAGATRWGSRGGVGVTDDSDAGDGPMRWRENGGIGGANFNDGGRGGVSGRGGGPMNIPPLDLNNPPQRPDFMNEFDNRSGPRGGGSGPRGGNHNGDFYPNMPNRFNQPTSLMQMRIPPPNAFNPRMGGPGGPGGPSGPPMFMRGQGGPGGGSGRQQGPGFFNQRNPFDRDMGGRGSGRGGGRSGGAGIRGGRGSGPGGPSNWSDEEGDDGINFKRRGGTGGGNRFRDRDGPDERHNRDRVGGPGGRRGMGERSGVGGPRDRHERDYRDNERDRERGGRSSNRRNSRDEGRETSAAATTNTVEKAPAAERNMDPDTEDDWDRELVEYDTQAPSTKATTNSKTEAVASSEKECKDTAEEPTKGEVANKSSVEAKTATSKPINSKVDVEQKSQQQQQQQQNELQPVAKQNENEKRENASPDIKPTVATPAITIEATPAPTAVAPVTKPPVPVKTTTIVETPPKEVAVVVPDKAAATDAAPLAVTTAVVEPLTKPVENSAADPAPTPAANADKTE